MRGEKRAVFVFKAAVGGITPACAGRRRCALPERRSEQDHPRVCGEKKIGNVYRHGTVGSPPRVRGEACWPCPLGTPIGSPPRVRGEVDNV